MSGPALGWLLLLGGLVGVELWLYLSGLQSLTNWLHGQYRRRGWLRWVVLGAIVLAALHLVFGWWGVATSPDPCAMEVRCA